MGRLRLLVLAAALTAGAPARAAGAASADAPAPDAPRIESIEFRRVDVFSEEEERWWVFRAANAIHAVTRESFVRRELLFAVGDPLDPTLLAETERNLRATKLFRRVSVRAEGGRVLVETEDAWTLLPRVALSRKGGVTEWSLGIEEGNLLGTGRELSFLYDAGADRTSRAFELTDPQFFWPHVRFGVGYSNLSDGESYELAISRPFYAVGVRQAAGIEFRHLETKATLYSGGEESAEWNRRERFLRAEGGLALKAGERGATRLSAGIEWDEVTLGPGGFGEPPPPGDPRRYFWIFAGVERLGNGWIERRQVDQLDRDEDFNLAPSFKLELGVSPSVFNAQNAMRLRATGSVGTLVPKGFALLRLGGEGRLQGGLQDALLTADLRGYRLRFPWTFVARLGTQAGWRLDPETQVFLDGLSGLRGYYLHAVAGEGRAVGNVEVRYFLRSNLLRLFSLGAAAFADAGVSWGEPDGTWDLADVGVGLRIGLTRASTNTLLRVDLARALRPDPRGRRGWQVSFSSGTAF